MPDRPAVATPTKPCGPDLFEIYDVTSLVLSFRDNLPFIFHLDYSLMWIQQGEGQLFIDSFEFSMGSNVLYCIRPGQQLRFSPAVAATGFVVCFEAAFLDLHETKTTNLIQESLFNYFLATPVLHLKNDATRFMNHVAKKMLEEFPGGSAYKKEMLKGLLKIFIIHTSRATNNIDHPSIVPKKVELVQQFYLLIERCFVSKKLVKDYADLLHLSAGYLNDVVREISGASASYHIQQRVFREAKRRMLFDGSSMKEIAFSLGFSNQAHFSKYFKNISGKSFTEFKNEITS